VRHNKSRRIDYRALADFRYEIRRFLNFSEQAARAAGIEPQQHQALLAIKGLPPGQVATVGALAERLQIQHHSAVELADRLESNGFICRSRNRKDRREVLLRLTRGGKIALQELSLPHRSELRSAGPTLLRALGAAIAEVRRAPRSRERGPGRARRRRNRKTNLAR
jgi:DNA-binding MarR family transcriptional regulator